MIQNQYEKLFDEFLDLIEFILIKKGKQWKLEDRQGGNLGDIEDRNFINAGDILEDLDRYIEDYIVSSLYKIIIQEKKYKNFEYKNWEDLILKAKPLFNDEEQYEIKILDMICNHFEEINLNNCHYEEKRKWKLGTM